MFEYRLAANLVVMNCSALYLKDLSAVISDNYDSSQVTDRCADVSFRDDQPVRLRFREILRKAVWNPFHFADALSDKQRLSRSHTYQAKILQKLHLHLDSFPSENGEHKRDTLPQRTRHIITGLKWNVNKRSAVASSQIEASALLRHPPGLRFYRSNEWPSRSTRPSPSQYRQVPSFCRPVSTSSAHADPRSVEPAQVSHWHSPVPWQCAHSLVVGVEHSFAWPST